MVLPKTVDGEALFFEGGNKITLLSYERRAIGMYLSFSEVIQLGILIVNIIGLVIQAQKK